MLQTIGMMNALGIARDLGADNTSGIAIVFRTAHTTNCAFIQQLNIERAGGWAIMRTGGMSNGDI